MILDSIHSVPGLTGYLSVNAGVTIFFGVMAIVAIKVISTIAGATVRDDSRIMEAYRDEYERDTPPPGR